MGKKSAILQRRNKVGCAEGNKNKRRGGDDKENESWRKEKQKEGG